MKALFLCFPALNILSPPICSKANFVKSTAFVVFVADSSLGAPPQPSTMRGLLSFLARRQEAVKFVEIELCAQCRVFEFCPRERRTSSLPFLWQFHISWNCERHLVFRIPNRHWISTRKGSELSLHQHYMGAQRRGPSRESSISYTRQPGAETLPFQVTRSLSFLVST